AVHVTGHGWRKLMRASQALRYVVTALPAVPPVLAYLVQASGMSVTESYGTFNMGAGFAFFVAPASVPRALALAEGLGFELSDRGRVEAGSRAVVLEPLGLTFEGDTLAIR
ncbi:MAG TPA: hypothetical protein VGQ57_08105, partial [Polyangiaceae bacterium]|nr:hypothetical protein [Polyangiaceae bacterium]